MVQKLQASHSRVVSAGHPLLVERLAVVELGGEKRVNLQPIVKLATDHRRHDEFCFLSC